MEQITNCVPCLQLHSSQQGATMYTATWNEQEVLVKKVQQMVGLCYENGEGVDIDINRAFQWYTKSAAQGNSAAQAIVNMWHMRIQQHKTNSLQSYISSACQGVESAINFVKNEPMKTLLPILMPMAVSDSGAQNLIGILYLNAGGPSNEQTSFKWFLNSAMSGFAPGQFNVAACYTRGTGIQMHLGTAFEWYLKAAQQGHVEAELQVAHWLENENGTASEESIKWYLKVANKLKLFVHKKSDSAATNLWQHIHSLNNHHHLKSIFMVSLGYANGLGVEQNAHSALEWYVTALNIALQDDVFGEECFCCEEQLNLACRGLLSFNTLEYCSFAIAWKIIEHVKENLQHIAIALLYSLAEAGYAKAQALMKRFIELQTIYFEVTPKFAYFPALDLCEKMEKFVAVIGRGSAGTVYRGIMGTREVAVKQLEIGGDMFISRQENEWKILNSCVHPNIVSVIDFVQKPLRSYLILEFMNCGSLYDAVINKKNKLTDAQVYKYSIEICKGLDYLHGVQKIIHRDLKSLNVLLHADEKGTHVKLADFDIAKFMDNKTATVSTGSGSFRWMAPEHMVSKLYTNKVDIWAFGMVLYEMHTNSLPFALNEDAENQTNQNIQAQIAGDKLPEWPTDCNPQIRAIAEKCWQRDPKKRPTATELIEMLQQALVENAAANKKRKVDQDDDFDVEKPPTKKPKLI